MERLGNVRVRFGVLVEREVGELEDGEGMGMEREREMEIGMERGMGGEGEGLQVLSSSPRLAIEEWKRVVVPVAGMRFGS